MTADLPPLAVAEFGDFFSALWTPPDGAEPPTAFDWQKNLVEQLEREHVWPGLIDLPTGTGKTSLLEIALFLQALDAERDPTDRWMPRRVVLVVDRRVVVDQADARGRTVACRLAAATEGDAVGRVASRLRYLSNASDDERPVVTSVLRGGIVRDESWARRPDVPALISSTVDQVGSRLLFRGYGISPSMRPVHAGLLASDCLFLLDEVHLARPFAQTLAAVADHRARAERKATPGSGRWHVVELSATPMRAAALTRFPAEPLDPGSHVVLRRRLLARKPARLASVALPVHPGKADRVFAEACADAVEGLLRTPDVTALGAIVNRVSTARAVAELLVERVATDDSHDRVADILLLTGRMRPVDRDRFLDEHRARLEMGRDRSTDARPLVLVATQCIEAGADFDLDVIVTECASLDALRQRFGRVDRDGQRSDLGAELTSVIFARGPSVAEAAEPDPVYGGALARTWAWLDGIADQTSDPGTGPRVDFGIRALPVPGEDVLAQLVPPALDAPVMLPAHLDAWVQTSPAPAVEPDVARWLHGIRDVEQDVQVVWRDDLHEALLDPDDPDSARSAAVERVRARPPVSTEAMSLPIAAVRRWLLRQEPAQIADVEGVARFADIAGGAQRKRPALRWAGSESAAIRPAGIQSGDTLVVPVQYGGIALGSWAPEARLPIDDHDIAAIASRGERRLVVVRLTRDRWRLLEEFAAFRETWEAATAGERRRMIDGVLTPLRDAPTPGPDRDDIADVLQAPHRLRDIRLLEGVEPAPQDKRAAGPRDATPADPASPFGPTVVITAPVRSPDGAASVVPIALAVAGDDDDEMSSSGRSATLADHLSGVARWATGFSERLGIDPEVAADVCLAAELHDIGKVDARFQVWLHGGDELAQAGATVPLAKSATPYYDRAERAAARDASGYPPGARHELASVAMVIGTDALRDWAHDPELVLHLVASHHGYCRGFAPVVRDPAPVTVVHTHDGVTLQASSAHGLERIDAGVAERFWRVVRRYGWFGVAWLETILRLADHRRSEQEPGVGKGS